MFEFNPLSPEFQANPYPYYDLLHEHMPRFFWERWGMWFFVRYEDCVAVLKDNRFVRDMANSYTDEQIAQIRAETPAEQKPLWDMERDWMLLRDPPTHTRLKMLVHKAFTPRTIERLRSHIQTITDELLDEAQQSPTFDLIEALAFPLPIRVIAELLGVPIADRELLRAWSRDLAVTLELNEAAEPYNIAAKATTEFSEYLHHLVAERRKQPREDLLSALVAAEESGDKLTENELIATVILLLVAGHETTVNLIGNGTLALLRHPQQMEKLRNDPTLIKGAVEEMLRYDSPVQLTARNASEDIAFNGDVIKKGQGVATLLGAANRDPRIFPEPNSFDITRPNSGQHIGFGNGIHYCLGAPLARVEGEIAINTLLRRLPTLALSDSAPTYRDTYVLRGMKHFPVRH